MFDLVEIDDLGFLDGHDLRSVFSQVSEPQIIVALSGLTPMLRSQLLKKLPPASAARLESALDSCGSLTPAVISEAQSALLEALCRLSRCGQVAFDIPGDMVA